MKLTGNMAAFIYYERYKDEYDDVDDSICQNLEDGLVSYDPETDLIEVTAIGHIYVNQLKGIA